MEAIKQMVRIPEDHEIKIKIPYYIPENEVVEVLLIVKKKPAAFKQKVEELKEAVRDKGSTMRRARAFPPRFLLKCREIGMIRTLW